MGEQSFVHLWWNFQSPFLILLQLAPLLLTGDKVCCKDCNKCCHVTSTVYSWCLDTAVEKWKLFSRFWMSFVHFLYAVVYCQQWMFLLVIKIEKRASSVVYFFFSFNLPSNWDTFWTVLYSMCPWTDMVGLVS